MIKEFKIIRIDCDNCGEFYPSTKDPVHFQKQIDAHETIIDAGWHIRFQDKKHYHFCPLCVAAVHHINASVDRLVENVKRRDGE